jgi:hypothetical protein
MTNLSIIRGDTLEFVFCAPSMQSLTGYSITFTAKKSYASKSTVFTCSTGEGDIVIRDQQTNSGEYRVLINGSKTQGLPPVSNYLVYDIQIKDALGNNKTIQKGSLLVVPDVSE